MPTTPSGWGKALAYAGLIWFTGFIWGTIVFMTPALKNLRSIPYVSTYPAISFPILVLWPFLTYFLAKDCLKAADQKAAAGLKLGLTFALVNIILDCLILVLGFKAGFGFFASLTVLLSYAILLFVPWLTGRRLAQAPLSVEQA